jgi:hypothetical protein
MEMATASAMLGTTIGVLAFAAPSETCVPAPTHATEPFV